MYKTYLNQIIKSARKKEKVNFEKIIEFYLKKKQEQLLKMPNKAKSRLLISKFNYEERSKMKSSELLGFKVKVGDICYIDFGRAFVSEAGYQHFAIIIGYCNSKALIVPMSSNSKMYYQSYCEKTFKHGKKHLYRLPELNGLNKKSVLFLNDVKFINTARIIQVKGHISPDSFLFKDIKNRFIELI